MWWPWYVEAYRALVTSFCDVLAAQLFGHFHSEEFRAPDWCAPPLLMAASVSPVYDTNPSFRAMTFSRATFALTDYCVHAAPINMQPLVWDQSHCARAQYGAANLSSAALAEAARSFSQSCATLKPFLSVYMEGVPEPCTSPAVWGCLLTTLASDEFARCNAHKGGGGGNGSGGNGVSVVGTVVAVALIVLIGAALALLFRCKPSHAYERLKQPADIPRHIENEIIA
jgi:hypothetical protein